MSSPKPHHWLENVAGHAGLELDLPSQPDIALIREVWPRVVRACGLPADRFTQEVAGHFRIAVGDVSAYDPQAVRLIPESIAREYGILAISATDSTIVVATSDPTNQAAQRDIVAHASRQPVFLLVSPMKLAQSMERAYAPARAPRNALQTLVARVAESERLPVGWFWTGESLSDARECDDTMLRCRVGRLDGVLQMVGNVPHEVQYACRARAARLNAAMRAAAARAAQTVVE